MSEEHNEIGEQLEKDRREAREAILDKLGPSAFRNHLEKNPMDLLTWFVIVDTLSEDEREMVREHISEHLGTYLLNSVWMMTDMEAFKAWRESMERRRGGRSRVRQFTSPSCKDAGEAGRFRTGSGR